MSGPVIVWWVKRDARLADNAPLAEAASIRGMVLPFFCFEPSVIAAPDHSQMHLHAQLQAVRHLREQLRLRHADVLIAHGEVCDKLQKLREIVPFTHLFAHDEIGNDITFQRDRRVAAWCRERAINYQEFPQSSVRRTGVNRDRLQALWQSRIVSALPLPIPEIVQSPPMRELAGRSSFPAFDFPANAASWQPVSECAAAATLEDFLTRRGLWYRGGISSPNTALSAGSRLSVHLAWGTITARQVWHATRRRIDEMSPDDPTAERWKKSLEAFLSRLHWRDHFTQRLESEPKLEFRSIHPSYRLLPYGNDERLHAAWRAGQTGYPLVDAVMRCLAKTGFVNFRMRALVVSFACHALHLDWRIIHPHLARVFRDYDPGIHLSQLQMQAGVVGWNAIRVYNPTKQLQDWDSQCRFVKRWLPELRDKAPDVILHAHEQKLTRYPAPIVDFASRARTMTDVLYAIRRSAEAIAATPAVYARHGSRKKETRFRPKKKPIRRTMESDNQSQPTLFD